MKPERIEELRERAESLVRGDFPGYGEVLVPASELLHLLRCARAWAELLKADPDTLTAIEAALAKAKGGAA